MNMKEEAKREMGNRKNYKIRYYKQSPWMKNRYKPEFVEQEIWIYTPASEHGRILTESSFNNKKYRKEFFTEMREECDRL